MIPQLLQRSSRACPRYNPALFRLSTASQRPGLTQTFWTSAPRREQPRTPTDSKSKTATPSAVFPAEKQPTKQNDPLATTEKSATEQRKADWAIMKEMTR